MISSQENIAGFHVLIPMMRSGCFQLFQFLKFFLLVLFALHRDEVATLHCLLYCGLL